MTAPSYTEPVADTHDAHGEHKSHDRTYVITAAVLGVITFVETATFLWPTVPVWDWGEGVGLTLFLVVLMIVKFVGVASIFMHLKYDNKLLATCFYSGLILAICVYFAVMFAFRFFFAGSQMVQ